VYGDRLHGAVVFGSVGRGRMRPDSDVDLLIVAEPLPDGRMARMTEFADVEDATAAILDAARRVGVHTDLSPIILTPDELEQAGFVVFDIAVDGRIIADRGDALAAHFAAIRNRLEKRGARRTSPTGARYWMLEPDVGPDDVVVL
jgi:predicted nucleotidyltransferase